MLMNITRRFVFPRDYVLQDAHNPSSLQQEWKDVSVYYLATDSSVVTIRKEILHGTYPHPPTKYYLNVIVSNGEGIYATEIQEIDSKPLIDSSGSPLTYREFKKKIDGKYFSIKYFQGSREGLVVADVNFENKELAESFEILLFDVTSNHNFWDMNLLHMSKEEFNELIESTDGWFT